MKINSKFTVIASGKVCYINSDKEPYKNEVELEFSIPDCQNFLFRFSPATLYVNDYKISFKYDPMYKIQGIFLFKDDKYMIVSNMNQLINDVHTGYMRLLALDKIGDIMEFDFKAGIDFQDNQDVEDEFEE